jgi:DNA-directed RNA polymerase specialized sigma subunit
MPKELVMLKQKGLKKAKRRVLINMLRKKGVTMTAIAKYLDISRQRVHQISCGYASN